MEEEEEENPATPFWLQTSKNAYGHRHRRSSSLFNPLLLIMLLAITALLFLFFVILPSVLSSVTQGSRPSSVKKNWDLVNFLLVLFAIACGFLNRKNEDSSSSSSSSSTSEANVVASHVSETVSKNPLQSTDPTRQWFQYSSDPRICESVGSSNASDSSNLISTSTNTVRLLRRNCSSYPDLKQEFSWASGGEHRWRFFDDNVIDFNAYRAASENLRRRLGQNIDPEHSAPPPPPAPPATETSNLASPLPPSPSASLSPPPPAPPPPPPHSPPPATRHRRSRTFHTVESKEKTESSNDVEPEINENRPSPPSSPPPPPPRPPPSAIRHRRSRTFHTVEHKEKKESSNEVAPEINKSRPLPPPSSPPPPPPPPPPRLASHHQSEQKSARSDRRGSGAKEIANTLASLYQYRKKKKKQKSKDDENSCNGTTQLSPLLHSGDSPTWHPPPSQPPPPPPPPPPPASVFHNLFSYKKTSKSKRIHSFSLSQLNPTPPPPPPPPPKPTSSSRSIKRKSKREAPLAPPEEPSSDLPEQRKRNSAASGRRPPLSTKTINMLYEGEENLSSGGQSPLIPMPPPPPPPPFRMSEMKFVVRGGFVRVRSNLSSLSSSPVDSPTKAEEPESVSSTSATTTTTTTTMKAAAAAAIMDGRDAIGAVFCPSPDVDTKADTFIARFRDGLRLEKIKSIKEKKAAHGPQSRPKSFLKN